MIQPEISEVTIKRAPWRIMDDKDEFPDEPFRFRVYDITETVEALLEKRQRRKALESVPEG